MTEQGWTRLALAAAALGVVEVVLLVALGVAPGPPATLPQRRLPVATSDTPPSEPADADPEELRAGMKALDAILATRLEREARARGLDPAALMPAREVRDAGVAAGDPGSDAGARLIAAWTDAFAKVGAPLGGYQ